MLLGMRDEVHRLTSLVAHFTNISKTARRSPAEDLFDTGSSRAGDNGGHGSLDATSSSGGLGGYPGGRDASVTVVSNAASPATSFRIRLVCSRRLDSEDSMSHRHLFSTFQLDSSLLFCLIPVDVTLRTSSASRLLIDCTSRPHLVRRHAAPAASTLASSLCAARRRSGSSCR